MTASSPAPRGDFITLSGWYGFANAGDDAILRVILSELTDRCGMEVRVLTRPGADVRQSAGRPIATIVHEDLVGAGALGNWLTGRAWRFISEIRKSRAVLIGGGSLVHDRMTRRSLARVLDEVLMGRIWGVRTAFIAVGVGPLTTALGKRLVRMGVRSADMVTVRDQASRDLLVSVGVPGSHVVVTSDPSFLLPSKEFELGPLEAFMSPADGAPVLGVYLVDQIGLSPDKRDRFVRSVASALDQLHRSHGARFVLVPLRCHAEGDDRIIAHEVAGHVEQPGIVHCHETLQSPEELKWLAGRFTATIAVRLHALFFSLAHHVPVVAIDRDPKVRNAMNAFDLGEYVVDIDDRIGERLVERTSACLGSLPALRTHLAMRTPVHIEQARKLFDDLRRFLGLTPTA